MPAGPTDATTVFDINQIPTQPPIATPPRIAVKKGVDLTDGLTDGLTDAASSSRHGRRKGLSAEPPTEVPGARGPAMAAARSGLSRPLSAAPRTDALGANPDAMAALEQLWNDFHDLRKELDRPDQIAFYGAVGQLIWLFLPWQETAREGSVMGLMTAGFVVLVGAVFTAAAIFYRRRDKSGRFGSMSPWLVQAAGAAFMIGWCLFAIRTSWDPHLVPGLESLETPASRPAFGAHIGLTSAVASLLGTLWGLKNKLS
jgi:hypothetical protein